MIRVFVLSLALCSAVVAGLAATPAAAQRVEVEELVLDNGMKFLLVPRRDQPNNIAAGWIAKVGSANERPGITGISHFFEHMMFKGTRTIGTRDPEKDAALIAAQNDVHNRMLKEIWTTQYARFRRGEIDDPWNPGNDTPPLRKYRDQLKALIAEHAAIIVPNEFDAIYARHGASGMNAFTSNDVTFYFVTLPSNKLELWAWMESDRLADSVFREFHAERDVVHEERRLRTESTPTGIFQEQFDAMFWQSSPYQWPVIGWPSDLNSYTMEQARRYYDTYYRPNNLVGILVGDFDIDEARELITSYFSRLERGEPPPPVVTLEMPQTVEKRFFAECDCQPQIEVRYHTVPFGHADSYALELLAAILNGRSGRLYRSMIEGPGIASSAQASAGELGAPAKHASYFSFTAEVKGNAEPEHLEQAWLEQLRLLQEQPVSDRELRKVKNQHAANTYRSLKSNLFLMLQLGIHESMTDWRYINESPAKFQAVTAADIQRVANTYFYWRNRSVAIYVRKEQATAPTDPTSATSDDPELLSLHPDVQSDVRGMLRQILPQTDPNMLRRVIQQIEAMKAELPSRTDAPPGSEQALDYVIRRVNERIAELESASPR